MTNHPASIAELENVFGKASQAGFGSAVFFNPKVDANQASLETESKAIYQTFCGATWQKFGAENWLATWAIVHERPAGSAGDIVSEIGSIADIEARSAAMLLFDAGEDSARAKDALSEAFDDAAIRQLKIFKIGDGAAMSGALIAAETNSDARQFLIILMD
jgi:hypothetical protein